MDMIGRVEIPASTLHSDLKQMFNNPLSSDVQLTVEDNSGIFYLLLFFFRAFAKQIILLPCYICLSHIQVRQYALIALF